MNTKSPPKLAPPIFPNINLPPRKSLAASASCICVKLDRQHPAQVQDLRGRQAARVAHFGRHWVRDHCREGMGFTRGSHPRGTALRPCVWAGPPFVSAREHARCCRFCIYIFPFRVVLGLTQTESICSFMHSLVISRYCLCLFFSFPEGGVIAPPPPAHFADCVAPTTVLFTKPGSARRELGHGPGER